MILNCSIDDNSMFSCIRNIFKDISLKRKALSDGDVNCKRAKFSVPPGFPHQWGLYPTGSLRIHYEDYNDTTKKLQLPGNGFVEEQPPPSEGMPIPLCIQSPLEGSTEKGCSGKQTKKQTKKPKKKAPRKQSIKKKKCNECVEVDVKAECTFQHNLKKTKNPQSMCYENRKTMPIRKWTSMGLSEKLPYYYITESGNKVCKIPFDNFYAYVESLTKNNYRINRGQINDIWKGLSYDQRLPFIFEAFLYQLSTLTTVPSECEIRDIFRALNKRTI